MDKSDFIPTASSTVSKNKTKKRLLQNCQRSQFEDEQSMFSTSSSSIRDNTIPESSYQLEEQRQLARTSLMRANKVAGGVFAFLLPKLPGKFKYIKKTKMSHQTPPLRITRRTDSLTNQGLLFMGRPIYVNVKQNEGASTSR